MRIAFTILAAIFALAGMVASAGDGETTQFKIITKRPNDDVAVKAERGTTVISVRSPFGISQMSIERKGERWPAVVLVRLHLQGLERLSVSNGGTTLHAAVSSQTGEVRLWVDGKEDTPLDRKSPFWTNIRIIGADGKPAKAAPLQGGYFELQLPGAIFAGNPRSITMGWIDFYRG